MIGNGRSGARKVAFHSFQAECHDALELPVAGGVAVALSRPSPEGNGTNEDSASVIPIDDRSGVLIVADGLGGHAAGHTASQLAVRQLEESLYEQWEVNGSLDSGQMRMAILNGFEAANERIREFGSGSATTLCVAEICENTIRTYHVGDSGAYLVGQRGKLKLQTIAHSPVGYAVEAGLLEEEDAIHHEFRHVISNVIGSEEMRIEIGAPRPIAPRDTLLLSSDGLLDNLLMHEISDRLRIGPLKEATQCLADLAAERMQHAEDELPSKPDDLTLVAFRRVLR